MKALAVIPGSTTLRFVERPEPAVSAPTDVKLQVLRVGICGTDREEAAGGRADAPPGQSDLVIGHEMFGQVVAVGSAVTRVKVGDYAVFTVRRSCGQCEPCRMNRSDMCETGTYTERGIKGLDGYQTEFVVDSEQYIIRIAPELKALGVLTEPTSVAEKAIEEVVRLQMSRLPNALTTPNWLYGRRVLVAGLGPIGLVAAFILLLRGADVFGLDIVDAASSRPQWLTSIGGQYIDGRTATPDKIAESIGPMDIIFESTGVAALEFNLLETLAINGAYVLTGIPGGDRPVEIEGAELIRELVLKNQVMVGSVNAARAHFQMAADDLQAAHWRWGDLLLKLITPVYTPDDFDKALHQHDADEIKAVIEWHSVT